MSLHGPYIQKLFVSEQIETNEVLLLFDFTKEKESRIKVKREKVALDE